MSNARKELVEKIFENLEPDKEGIVSLDKLSEIFNPEAHPDVLAGLRKPDDVYRRCLQ